jgi:Na+/proline symporter/signal transduction histidine kinase
MGKLHHIDVAIIVSYLLFITVLGLFQAKKIKNIEQYTVGDRNFSIFAIVATMFATYISAQYILGKTGKVYELGLLFMLPFFIQPLVWITTSIYFSKNLEYFKNSISVVDIMELAYKKTGKYVTAISSILFSVAVLSVQTTAIAYLFQHFLGLSYEVGAFIGIGVVTLYSALGGVRSVIITDIFQFLIFFFIIPIACGYAYFKSGGYHAIMSKIPETHKQVDFTLNNVRYIISLILLFLMPFIEASYCQRLLIARDSKQIKQSLKVIFLCAFLLTFSVCIIGLIVKSEFPDIDSNLSFYYFIDYSLTDGLKGLIIVGLLAVIQSSADSWINTSSSIIAKDIIKPFLNKPSDKQLVLIAKLSSLFIAVCAVTIALISKQILELIWLVNNFNFPVLFVPLLLALRRVKTTEFTFIFSTAVALIFVLIGRYYTGEFDIESSMIGVFGSGLGFYIAHQYQIKKGIIEVSKNEVFKINLKQYISNAINNIIDIQHKIAFNKSLLYIIALLIMFVNIPILAFGYSSFTDIANIIAQLLRYATLLLSISLILHALLNVNKNPILLWHLLLLLAFPLTSAYMLFMSDYTIIWGLNYFISVVGLFVLTNLYYAWILIIIGTSIAVILILACKLLLQSETILSIQIDNVFSPLYSSILLLIVLIFIIYSKFREEKIKQHSLEILGRSLAHDVSAPLTIGITISHLIRNALKNKKFELISDYVDNLEQCNAQAIQDIDIMLSSIKVDNNVKPKDWGTYSLNTCIIEALNNFQMTQDNKERVKYISKKEEDFKFTGSPTLVRHIIFNLLKNAFKYAGNEAKIEIYIKKNKLHIKDNGYGIENKIMKLLFQKNITTDGYGVGLNFCKQAMLKMHGDIICRSKKEFGAEFILSFSNRN